jgi:Raf kinase inhibitor-like YbhB/YbcL family protein
MLFLVACARSEGAGGIDTLASVSSNDTKRAHPDSSATAMNLDLTSAAFTANGAMPAKYTCEGADVSPPLAWTGAVDVKTYALIVEDPDAPDPAKPTRVVTHWLVYNIPSNVTSLAENASKNAMPAGAVQGPNERKAPAYMGPCPPIGRHRYFFKLFALDTALTLKNPSKAELEKALEGHVIGKAELIGTYQKRGTR